MNIVITGASNGIGFETARKFSGVQGIRIVALSRDEKKLDTLASKGEGKIIPLKFDLSNFDSTLLLQALKKNNIVNVDILINNAGHLINKPFDFLTNEDWNSIYRVNVFGAVQMIKTLLPFMGIKSKAHIVNISSYGGFQGSQKFPGLSAYSSSKAALANLTECLAGEFKNKNISVNCLALGAAQTEMLQNAFPGYKAPVTASEMAEFIFWFAVNGNKFFNGKIIPVASGEI